MEKNIDSIPAFLVRHRVSIYSLIEDYLEKKKCHKFAKSKYEYFLVELII